MNTASRVSKILLSISGTVAILSASNPAVAREVVIYSEAPPTTTLTANPLDLVSGIINFQLEHAVQSNASVYVGLNFIVFSPAFEPSNKASVFAVGPEAGVRFFLLGTAPEGLFIGPFGTLDYVSAQNQTALGWSAGGMMGVTVLPFDVIDLSLGIGAEFRDYAVDWQGARYGYYGWEPRLRLAAGFAF